MELDPHCRPAELQIQAAEDKKPKSVVYVQIQAGRQLTII